jgi:hypothetical protein
LLSDDILSLSKGSTIKGFAKTPFGNEIIIYFYYFQYKQNIQLKIVFCRRYGSIIFGDGLLTGRRRTTKLSGKNVVASKISNYCYLEIECFPI